MPTSITIVRLTELFRLPIRDSHELHSMAINMSNAAERPRTVKCFAISVLYCRKNTNANIINAGKAVLPSIILVFNAPEGK